MGKGFFKIVLILLLLVVTFWVSSMFKGNLGLDTKDLILVKYILAGVVILIIFIVLTYMGFPQNILFRLIFSVIIGFLATAYIVPTDVLAILNSYLAFVLALAFALILYVFYLIWKGWRGGKYSNLRNI